MAGGALPAPTPGGTDEDDIVDTEEVGVEEEEASELRSGSRR